jgi:predicted Rossmann fold nucleotide-binding protein DprA/Smf involved in DNA uptake
VSERVAIVGSRNYAREDAVRSYVAALPAGTIVISGGARGVDTWAEDAAESCGLIRILVLAAWMTRIGTRDYRAGKARNPIIVELAERVVAFWDGRSPGTAHTIETARKAGKPVEVIW